MCECFGKQHFYLTNIQNNKSFSNHLILFLIIVVGIVLRGYNFQLIPFTHDEFSALFRTNFDKFADLIEKGVKVDGHPAGVQIFLYYWVKIFGIKEWVVKFPFFISGVLSIYLIFLIAKTWFNETVALITSSYLASLQFPIMYSQIARPYSSGLFFSLSMFYFWTKIIHSPSKDFYKNGIYYILFSTLCAYNHHFSLLLAGIVGIWGVFYISKNYRIKYFLLNVIVVLLYLPHINIFFHQLGMGGIEGWLAKPRSDFIVDFLYYMFNFSNVVLLLTICIVIYGLKGVKIKELKLKNYLIFSILFFLPYLIGYFYSKFVNAVLQFSVLIFNFPFLFFLLFGHIRNQKSHINLILVLCILSINIFALVVERQHYRLFYNSRYEHIITDSEGFGNDTSTIILVDSHKRISSYYIKKYSIDSSRFIWLSDFPKEIYLINFLKNSIHKKNKLYFGCVSSVNPVIFSILNDYYPFIEWQRDYHGGTTFLLTTNTYIDSSYLVLLNFDKSIPDNWTGINPNNIVDSIFYSPEHAYVIDKNSEWGPTYVQDLNKIPHHHNDFIDVSVKIKPIGRVSEILLVSQMEVNDKLIDWRSSSVENYLDNENNSSGWLTMYHSIKLSDSYLRYKKIQLKIFIWNKGKNSFYIDDFKIKVRKGNRLIYGLSQKIE